MWGRRFEQFILILTWAVIVCVTALSVPDVVQSAGIQIGYFVIACNIFFAILWPLRLYTAPGNFRFKEDDAIKCFFGKCCDPNTATRLRFLFSFRGSVNLAAGVSLLAAWMTGYSIAEVGWTQYLRLIDCLTQMFSRGRPMRGMYKVFSRIFVTKFWFIMMAAYLLCAVWAIFACLYHLTERNNPELDGRFDTLLGSTWYSLVFLLGEFPAAEKLSMWGKVIAVFNVYAAIAGVNGIATGIIIQGYSDSISARRDKLAAKAEVEEKLENHHDLVVRDLNAAVVPLDTTNLQERLYLAVVAGLGWGAYFNWITHVALFLNIIGLILNSVKSIHHTPAFAAFYKVMVPTTMVIFTVEYVVRFIAVGASSQYSGCRRLLWMVQFFPAADLLCVVPFWVQQSESSNVDHSFTNFIRIVRMLEFFRIVRLFKMVRGTEKLFQLLYSQLESFLVLFYGVVVLWVAFSVGLYYTERHNPASGIAQWFDTIPKAMWITLLNLSGEYPIGEYTQMGRVVSFFVVLIAVAIFGIIPAIIADEAAAAFESLDVEEEEEVVEVEVEANRTAERSPLGRLWLFLEGQDLQEGDTTLEDPWWEVWGIRFQFFILAVILLNVLCFIFGSVSEFNRGAAKVAFHWVEAVSVGIFSVEYLLRLTAAYGDPHLRTAWYRPLSFLGYMFSLFGLVDLLSIAPWYIGQFIDNKTLKHLTVFRALRLLRLLRIERYLPAFSMLGKVFTNKCWALLSAAYITMVWTLIFACLLHMTEQGNTMQQTLTGATMEYRYRSIPTSIYYTFLHLTGDYPLYKYTLSGRVVNFFMIVVGQILVGLPIGIIVDGFQTEFKKAMERGEKKRLLDQANGGWPSNTPKAVSKAPPQDTPFRPKEGVTPKGRRWRKLWQLCCAPKSKAKEDPGILARCGSPARCGDTGFDTPLTGTVIDSVCSNPLWEQRSWCYKLWHDTKSNRWLHRGVIPAMMILAVLCMFLQSDRHLAMQEALGVRVHTIVAGLARVAATFFLVESASRLLVTVQATLEDRSRGGTWTESLLASYLSSIILVADVCAWLPFFVVQGYPVDSTAYATAMVLQALLLIKIERILPAFTLFDDVLSKGDLSRMLMCTLVLALIVWILFASLFYIIEQHATEMQGNFANMPLALFYTQLFLGGEWALCDLAAPAGQIVGAILAIFGIGIVSIPIGVFFDAFADMEQALIGDDDQDNILRDSEE